MRQPRPADEYWRRAASCSTIGRMVAAPSSSVSSRPRPMKQPVGEDMAALEIGAQLDFVDGEKRDIEIERHRLDGRDPVARVWPA